jgi:GR25 family glycosyltransferase involved in LPS biosynthesis
MNIIKKLVKTPYIFHTEDDWKFFVKRAYIADSLDVLDHEKRLGQCLFNKNYAEIESDIDIKGGFFKVSNSGIRYFIHEFVTQDKMAEWVSSRGGCKSSSYWPNFSFRCSVIRKSVLDDVGDFNESVSHFEMDYAGRYTNKGYQSAFFENIHALHIGRLTSEIHDETKLNAYILNEQKQFSGKEEALKEEQRKIEEQTKKKEIEVQQSTLPKPSNILNPDPKIKTVVLNLDRRPDRWETFEKFAVEAKFLNYERFPAVDGTKLVSTPQLQKIFDGNDYRMRIGLVGCSLSHFKMYTDLINNDEYDSYLIFEDDIEFTPDFEYKFNHLLKQLKTVEWDLVFVGHHTRDPNNKEVLSKDKLSTIEKWDKYKSFTQSLGGTTGYLISKKGAEKFLDFVNSYTMINSIDTMLQNSANTLKVYYTNPHLIFSECFRGDQIDSDIQYDYSTLYSDLDERVKEEIEYYKNDITLLSNFEEAKNYCINKDNTKKCYYKDYSENIDTLQKLSTHPCYKFEEYNNDHKILFIIPGGDEGRYFHIFKKNGKYDVSDTLVFKE